MHQRLLALTTLFCLLQSIASAQQVVRRLLYTASSAGELPQFLPSCAPSSPEGEVFSMFYVEEPGGYQVFFNGEDKGLYPKIPDVRPTVDLHGSYLLPITLDGQAGVEINGVQHGPFKQIDEVQLNYGHVMIKHRDPQAKKSYVYLDGKNAWESTLPLRGPGSVRIDGAGNLIRDNLVDVFLNDSLLCRNCGIPFNQGAGRHYFVFYRQTGQKEIIHYLYDGQRYGPISDYWAPRIDTFGNFLMPHQQGGVAYVQVNQERFGPVRAMEDIRSSSGAFGVLFSYQTPDDVKSRRHLYVDGQVLGPYDSIQVYPGSDIYYFETAGKKRLGQGGKVIFELPDGASLKKLRYNGRGQYLFALADGSVYRNGQFYRQYPLVREVVLLEDGTYYIFYVEADKTLHLDFNGRPFALGDMPVLPAFYRMDNLLVSADRRHFLKHSPDFAAIYVDDVRIACPAERAWFYNLKSENAFAWLTQEDNQYYWHTLKLD